MYIPLLWILVCFLCIIIIFLIICCINLTKSKNTYLYNWSQWEREYWILRQSDAIDKENYDIHLSWLPRGNTNCVVFKKNKEIDNYNLDNINKNI